MVSRLFAVVFLLLAMPAISSQPRPLVVASIEPLSMVMRDLLGDRAEVRTLLLPGQNPHHASMTPGQARLVRDADLLVWLGESLEPQVAGLVARRNGPALVVEELPGVYLRGESSDDQQGSHHDHDHDHDNHQHGGLDPHAWLYPANMQLLAEALLLTPPAGLSASLLANPVADFTQSVDKRVAALRELLAPVAEISYLSHHDPWGYFSDAFSVSRPMVISSNIEASASSRRFVELTRQVRDRQVSCILAEPEGSRALLRRLCGENCRLVEADPLGRHMAGASYGEFLDDLAGRFLQCLEGESAVTEELLKTD